MQIVEIQENWPDDLLRVNITLGNVCNYKCWYCWPGSNEGTYGWPDFDTFTENLSYLLDYYLNNTNKRRFDFHVMGGEATHWKRFIEFIKFFKDRYDCVFSLTTNAVKNMDWWNEAYQYLDYVDISVHREFTDVDHVIEVADFLYKKNVLVMAKVMMDPTAWDQCVLIVDKLKRSKHRWAIWHVEVIHNNAKYTEDQRSVLSTLRARRANLFYFFRTNKSYRSCVRVKDITGRSYRVANNHILLKRLNNFKGWNCNVGVDWVAVKEDGTLSGICSNPLFNMKNKFNLFNNNFTDIFSPDVLPTTCQQTSCLCMYETNMPKRKF